MALNIDLMKQKLANSQNKNAGKNSGTKWRPSEGDQTIQDALKGLGVKWLKTVHTYEVGKVKKTISDALNSSLNVQNKDLWLVSQFGGTYTIVIIQRITGLDSQSKVLEKKRYYENRYNDYVFNKNIIRRRKMREHLNSDK